MGSNQCCGSRSTYGVPPEEALGAIRSVRERHGDEVLIMAIKDQNLPGKLCLSGNVEQGLIDAIFVLFKDHPWGVTVEKDDYDLMWDVVFRGTVLTSGCSALSLAKSWFPKGKLVVALFDAIASFGWSMSAAPNFGGVEARNNDQVSSCVDWPVFVFYKDSASPYTNQHLLLAVKDSNIPGKLCAAGPVGELEAKMTSALGAFREEYDEDVKSEKDSYDDDYDIVWRHTKITSGMSALSFAKAYFPKGKINIAVLKCAYSCGWRAVAAPNFGGQGDSWPCVVFRQLKNAGSAASPDLIFASIKDSNQPGKLCFSGDNAERVNAAVCSALANLDGNVHVKSEKDFFDIHHDCIARNVQFTTGMQFWSMCLPYFPRGDSTVTFLNTMAAQGFQIAACPNFGGMLDSWPTFIFEQGEPKDVAFLAVKDDNYPGKVVLGGPGIAEDASLGPDLLEVLTKLCGTQVVQEQDEYDKTYALAFRGTKLTTGWTAFSMSKPYWPHGYVVEAILRVMMAHGWRAIGGPNFGDDGNSWPGFVFQKMK